MSPSKAAEDEMERRIRKKKELRDAMEDLLKKPLEVLLLPRLLGSPIMDPPPPPPHSQVPVQLAQRILHLTALAGAVPRNITLCSARPLEAGEADARGDAGEEAPWPALGGGACLFPPPLLPPLVVSCFP